MFRDLLPSRGRWEGRWRTSLFCVWTAEALPRGDGEERFCWARVVGMLSCVGGEGRGLNRARASRWLVDEKGKGVWSGVVWRSSQEGWREVGAGAERRWHTQSPSPATAVQRLAAGRPPPKPTPSAASAQTTTISPWGASVVPPQISTLAPANLHARVITLSLSLLGS